MITYLFAGIPVADRAVSMAWYERFVGRPADLIPNEDEAAWEMSGSGWIYIVADPDRAGSALNALIVDDLDAFLAGLREGGIEAGPLETIGGGTRHAIVTDPDGNRLNVGQPPADPAV